MNYTSLRNWSKLTAEEKERIKYIYGPRSPEVTETMHDTNPESLEKAKKQEEENDG